jgi:predicted DNA-binding protein with PD1-like motif
MKTKLISQDREKTHAIIFADGDEFMQGMRSFAVEQGISAAHFTAIGAFSKTTLGYYDMEKKEYKKIPVNEQVEALSLIGDIALKGEEVEIHAHVVAGKADGSTVGGHIMEAQVRPTLEVMLTESPSHLQRKVDQNSGLALISI